MKKIYFMAAFAACIAISTANAVAQNLQNKISTPEATSAKTQMALRGSHPQGTEPDSIIFYNGNGQLKEKTVFDYNKDMTLITETHYKYSSLSEWVPKSRLIRENKNSGKNAEVTVLEWDPSAKKFVNEEKTDYTFNEKSELIQYINYEWENGTWVPDEKEVFGHDQNGNITLVESSEWDKGKNAWRGTGKTVSVYNAAGKHTLYESYYWNEKNASWVMYMKLVMEYNANGLMTLEENHNWEKDEKDYSAAKVVYLYSNNNRIAGNEHYMWDDNRKSWTLTAKNTVTATDASGYPTESEDYQFNAETKEFDLTGKLKHTYDSKGRETYKEISQFVRSKRDWTVVRKETYAYDGNSNETYRELWGFDSNSGTLIGYHKQTRAYDANGNTTLDENYGWDYERKEWKGTYKKIYVMDGKKVSVCDQYGWNYNTKTFVLEDKEVYFYPTPTGIDSDKATASKVYVNGGSLVVNTDATETVTVYSVSGKVVCSIAKNEGEAVINNIPAGLYIVKGSSWSTKVLVK